MVEPAKQDNFLERYLDYVKGPDVPILYHKWCGVMGVAVALGKRIWFQRGPYKIVPNLYVMLMGEPGTGKGTACFLIEDLLKESGYEYFAADRSSKEKFLQDLADGVSVRTASMADGASNSGIKGPIFSLLEDASSNGESRECFILAEEFNDFIGQNNSDFVAFLTKMWSYQGTYGYRIKTGKSIRIKDPCISILGGNTSQGFANAFPPEISNQGFLARFILVSGDATGSKTSFPDPPESHGRERLARQLERIRNLVGEVRAGESAKAKLDQLNQDWKPLGDARFKDYGVRRFTQLIKLSMVFAAANERLEILNADIEAANSLLLETEKWMSKALGAFGKSRHSDTSNKILQYLYSVTKPVTTLEVWKVVADDLEKFEDLVLILQKLHQAERIQRVNVARQPLAWLPLHAVPEDVTKIIVSKTPQEDI